MKKLKRILPETFVILLLQILIKVQAGCYWDTNNCAIDCFSDAPAQVMAQLEQIWTERESCHDDGIILTMNSLNYPNFIVKADWFTAQVRVRELVFHTSSVSIIEANAFDATALKTVTKFTFPSMSLNPISKGIFNGLESLEELYFTGAGALRVIETGVLDALSGTLKKFSLETLSSSYSEINIDGLTGSEPLTALTTVKYRYTLKSTLTRKSFAGLQNVKTLDLSECQIETIGAGTFDPIGDSVRELNLMDNKIKTLPDGIFYNILLNDIATIKLGGNKWECFCELMPFKMTLIEHTSRFVGPFKCNNPIDLRDYDVIERDFCDEYDPPTTTQGTTTTTTTTTTTSTSTTTSEITTTEQATTNIPTEPPISDEFNQICYEASNNQVSKTVSIKAPKSGLKINENLYGDPVLEVEVEIKNSVLIWFSQLDQETYNIAGEDITCLISSGKAIPIPDLKEDIAYTFCLMDSTEKTVSPLDCISYTNTRANVGKQNWISNDDRNLIISMAVLACFISASIGWVIGFFTLSQIIKKKNRRPNGMSCINEVLKETLQSNGMMRQQNRMSTTTASSGNTKRATNYTIDYYLENAPPLPARPQSMFPLEEPVYAVVRDYGTKK